MSRWMRSKGDEGQGREQLGMVAVIAVVMVAAGAWALAYSPEEETVQDRSWGTGLGATILGATAVLLLLWYFQRRAARHTRDRKACKARIRELESQGYKVPANHKCFRGKLYIPKFPRQPVPGAPGSPPRVS